MALGALLFRPVQRMCLYPLLFQQIVASAKDMGDADAAALFTQAGCRRRAPPAAAAQPATCTPPACALRSSHTLESCSTARPPRPALSAAHRRL